MNSRRSILIVYSKIVVFIFTCAVFFSASVEANTTDTNNLKNRIQLLLNNPSLKNVPYGISIISIKNETPLFSYRDNDLISVASNMKLLTTSAALDYLGTDFEYKTTIEADGKIKASGELVGNIIIKGSGDPNLSGRFYNGNIAAVTESWANAIITRSEEHTSELQSQSNLVCRLLLEKKI